MGIHCLFEGVQQCLTDIWGAQQREDAGDTGEEKQGPGDGEG